MFCCNVMNKKKIFVQLDEGKKIFMSVMFRQYIYETTLVGDAWASNTARKFGDYKR